MSKPIVVRNDGAVVKIYKVSAGKGYGTYQLSYYQGGQRKRESITDKSDAVKRANDIASNLALGKASLNDLSLNDREIYGECIRIIKPSGMSLLSVCGEFMRTWKRDFNPVSVKVTVTKYLKSLEDEKRSVSHRRSSKHTLDKFSEKFGSRHIDEMEANEIRDWIAESAKNGRTRNNWLNRIRTAFNYGKKELKGIKLGDVPAPTAIKLWEVPQSVIKPWTDLELADYMAHIILDPRRDSLLLFVIVQAWGGLRVAEASRLQWKDIHHTVDEDERPYVSHIEIGASKAKTKTRRTVRCEGFFKKVITFLYERSSQQNLWKKDYKNQRISPYKEPQREIRKIVKGTWGTNIIRHSCATHLINLWEDENRVASFMGTSSEMLNSNYKELASPREAKAWFAADPFTYVEDLLQPEDYETNRFIADWKAFCEGHSYLNNIN